jgi:hypothetical protein
LTTPMPRRRAKTVENGTIPSGKALRVGQFGGSCQRAAEVDRMAILCRYDFSGGNVR